jgi:hypothetical protein
LSNVYGKDEKNAYKIVVVKPDRKRPHNNNLFLQEPNINPYIYFLEKIPKE